MFGYGVTMAKLKYKQGPRNGILMHVWIAFSMIHMHDTPLVAHLNHAARFEYLHRIFFNRSF